MKTKLNLTIENDLVQKSKKYAKAKGISVSKLVENMLRDVTQKHQDSFSQKWQGKFKAVEKNEIRYKKLEERYLQ